MNDMPRNFNPGMGPFDDRDQMDRYGTNNDEQEQMDRMSQMDRMDQMGRMNQMDHVDRMNQMDQMGRMNQMDRMSQMGRMNPMNSDNFPAGAFPALPPDASVTMAYIPFQLNTEVYDDMRALQEGTLFPVLNKPFLGAYAK